MISSNCEEKKQNHPKLWFLGNALLDFSANCSSAILDKYHLRKDDNCEYTEAQKGIFEELLKRPSVVITSGGSAQNSARVSRWLLKDRNSSVTFVGCVGSDSYGEILRKKVESAGVIVCYDYHPTESTGTTAGLVTSKDERTLCARLGAATNFRKEFLQSSKADVYMKIADLLYVEGYFIAHNPHCVSEVANFAFVNLKLFALNVSAVYVAEECFENFSKLLSFTDILFGNSNEILALARKVNPEISDVESGVKTLADLPSEKDFRIVVATAGPNATLCCEKGREVKFYPVQPVSNIIDTIGAGDAFVGGFLAVWLKQRDLNRAMLCGNETARLVVQYKGCTFPENVPDCINQYVK